MKYDINKVTPRPWRVDRRDHISGDDWLTMNYGAIDVTHNVEGNVLATQKYSVSDCDERAANAAHIVHCVNTHEALVEALEAASEVMERMGDILNGMDTVTPEDEDYATPRFEKVNAALALAKEGAA